MAVLTLTGRNVTLTSTWRYYGNGVPFFTDPTTEYDALTFDLSGIPEGAEIQSAYVSASRWGSGAIRTMNGVDADRAEINPSNITPGGELRITFAYKANGRVGSGMSGTLSDTAGWNNITLSVTYEMPYTAPTAPTQLSVSKAMATPGESVILSWSGAKAGNNVPIIGYGVFRASSADGEYTLLTETNAETLNLSVSAPASAGSYFYKVMALGGVDGYNSALSSAYAQVSVAVTAPKAPSALSLSDSKQYPGGSAVLSFSGASAGENNEIRGYAMWQSSLADSGYEKANTLTSTAASGSFTVTAPQSGSRYFKVQTLGKNMDGALSESYATLTADLSGTSDFSLSTDTVDAGAQLIITLLSNTDKDHDLIASIGEYSETIMTDAGQGTINFTPPLEWLNAMPDSEKAPVRLKLITHGAGTIEKTAFLRCPDDVVPIVSGAYAVRIDNDIPASWGVYVQGKSQADIHLDQEAVMAYGSPIVSYRMEGAGMTAESVALPFTLHTGLLNAGSIPIIISATDARGRTGSQQLILSVESYQEPGLKNIITQRCDALGEIQDEGVYALADAEEVVFSCGGNNIGRTIVSYRQQGSETWIEQGALSGGHLVFGGGQMDIGKNYEIRYIITDTLGGAMAYYDVITRAKPELHIRRGGGAWAFGGLADKLGALKVYGDLMMTGNLIASSEMAGKILYVSDSGVFQPLTLGKGMYIADGVLQLGTPPGEGTPLSELAPGTLVYVMENMLTPYLVLAHGHHGSGITTLIRYRASNTTSDFHSSTPSGIWDHKYSNSRLNTAYATYYSSLPSETQGKLESVDIPVRTSAQSSTITTVTAHMFALSEMEYLGSGSAEGSHIAYFADNASRIAYAEDGSTKKAIWTRSVTGGMEGFSRFINESGGIGNNGVTTGMALRPACCVKSDLIATTDSEGRYIL